MKHELNRASKAHDAAKARAQQQEVEAERVLNAAVDWLTAREEAASEQKEELGAAEADLKPFSDELEALKATLQADQAIDAAYGARRARYAMSPSQDRRSGSRR